MYLKKIFIITTYCIWFNCIAEEKPINPAEPTNKSMQNSSEKNYQHYKNGYPTQAFYGDTHVHTSYSVDAGLFGNIMTPDDAYKFAKGEKVTSSTGVIAKLDRPLDFLVVSDHAENLGLYTLMKEKNPALLDLKWGADFTKLIESGDTAGAFSKWGTNIATQDDPLKKKPELIRTMWGRQTQAAEKHNKPGEFSAIIGFEWTSTPNGNNLHRNILFRNGKDVADKVIPYSSYDSENPEDLWKWMEEVEKTTKAKILAIAHNGNLSNGLMFDDVKYKTTKKIDTEYAKTRSKWEPVYEITQIKGDGETHPSLSPADEFADFDTWDTGGFKEAKEKGMIRKEYAREAWKRGLDYEKKLKYNPFKFGVIGSTDAHTGLSSTQENNFFGKITSTEKSKAKHPDRFKHKMTGILKDSKNRDIAIKHYKASASGLAGVWAIKNTREDIWDAFARKEVFATTGTRLRLRLFCGGDQITQQAVGNPKFAEIGYQNGVPMGGDLSGKDKLSKINCLVQAVKDPDGANIDRIQIIKGWLDADGNTHEKVHDVVWSGDREKSMITGKLPEIQHTVNIKNASYENNVGSPTLEGFWTDEDFKSNEKAFYYIRVLEIPTPRWTTYDAKLFDLPLPQGIAPIHQERGYSTPIWYTP